MREKKKRKRGEQRRQEDNDALVLSDSDYVANLDARRYVTGYAFTIDNSLAS